LTRLRSFHCVVGLVTLVIFLATGAYMRLVAHPSELADRAHLMFVSRHIYILASALVHLVLAAYVAPCPARGRLTVQWIASALLGVSSLLLISAFVFEPVAGRARTDVSTFGLYTLFAGALLHFFVTRTRHPMSTD
jgi:cytochrome bd-type quinol oxidase subunit 2